MKRVMISQFAAKANQLLRSYVQKEDGGILILAAFAIPVLLPITALSVDLNRYLKSSGYVQSAVDQAALAATAVDGQDRNEVARRFFNASMAEEVSDLVVLNSINVQESFPAGGPLSITVTAQVTIKNTFASLLGVSDSIITRSGQSTRTVQNVEAVVMMASGGTMCSTKERRPNTAGIIPGDTLIALSPDSGCGHFNAMKRGVLELVDLLENNETVADISVGLVPYNFKIKMPNPNNIPASVSVNGVAGFYETTGNAEPLSAVVPLTDDMNALRRSVNGLTLTPAALAWSRSDLGSHVGALMLDPNMKRYFGGKAPKPFNSADTQKVMVLITDGVNTGCCFTNWPANNFDNQYVYFYKPYNDSQIAICDELKKFGVKIFTILLDVAMSDGGGPEINNVFARCATGTYHGSANVADVGAMLECSDKENCYNVKDDTDLVNAYRQIAQTFYKPRITK